MEGSRWSLVATPALGAAMAMALREAGVTVVVSGRDEHKNEVARGVLGAEAVVVADVRDERSVEAAVEQVTDTSAASTSS